MRLEAQFRKAFEAERFSKDARSVLVACSGGGDSIALLHLITRALGAAHVHCVTVNHNLRPEAVEEAAFVAKTCADLGVAHVTLDWHWEKRGNLQAAARDGRRKLLLQHARAHKCAAIFLGHTADDQAETVLMRLGRGSGVDGLGGMSMRDGPFERPLMDITREDLRTWLTAEGLTWREDASNEDDRFTRVKARALATELERLGLTQNRLLRTADLMRDEADALAYAAKAWAGAQLREDGPDLIVKTAAMRATPRALVSRVMASAIAWFSGTYFKPRRDALELWIARGLEGRQATLSGVMIVPQGETLRLTREQAAVRETLDVDPGKQAHWDHRWSLTPPDGFHEAVQIARLGDGITQCPDWRATGLPRVSLCATPGVWQGDTLIAAPVAGWDQGWTAKATRFSLLRDSH